MTDKTVNTTPNHPTRRAMLTGATVAAPLAVLSAGALAATEPDADAAFLRTFTAYTLSDGDSGVSFGDVPDAPVSTVAGALAKLCFAARDMWDPYEISHEDRPLPRTLASLRSSAIDFPEPWRTALGEAVDSLEGAAKDHRAALDRAHALTEVVREWKRLEDVFARYGASAHCAENARRSVEGPPSADYQRIVEALEVMDGERRRQAVDFLALIHVQSKISSTLEAMMDRSCVGSRELVRHFAGEFAELAARYPVTA